MNQANYSDNDSWEGTEVLDPGIKTSQLIITNNNDNSDNEDSHGLFHNLQHGRQQQQMSNLAA